MNEQSSESNSLWKKKCSIHMMVFEQNLTESPYSLLQRSNSIIWKCRKLYFEHINWNSMAHLYVNQCDIFHLIVTFTFDICTLELSHQSRLHRNVQMCIVRIVHVKKKKKKIIWYNHYCVLFSFYIATTNTINILLFLQSVN